MTSSSSILD
jgi:hypothetical protein